MKFLHESLAQGVAFASGQAPAAVAAEVAALGATRPMLIASEREAAVADPVAAAIPIAVRHDEVVMHVPVEVAERARAAASSARAVSALTLFGSGDDLVVAGVGVSARVRRGLW